MARSLCLLALLLAVLAVSFPLTSCSKDRSSDNRRVDGGGRRQPIGRRSGGGGRRQPIGRRSGGGHNNGDRPPGEDMSVDHGDPGLHDIIEEFSPEELQLLQEIWSPDRTDQFPQLPSQQPHGGGHVGGKNMKNMAGKGKMARDRCSRRAIKFLRSEAKHVMKPHSQIDDYFQRLIRASKIVSSKKLMKMSYMEMERRCGNVRNYLGRLKECKRESDSHFIQALQKKFRFARKCLVRRACMRGVSSIIDVCQMEETVPTASMSKASLKNMTRSERIKMRRSHRMSWRITRRCHHFTTLGCAAKSANLTLNFSPEVQCLANETHGSPRNNSRVVLLSGADLDLMETSDSPPRHQFPKLPGFIRDRFDKHTGKKPLRGDKKLGPQNRGRKQGSESVYDGDDEEEETAEKTGWSGKYAEHSMIAVKVILGVALLACIVFIVLYVRHVRRRRHRLQASNKHSGSNSSVSTTITDTGEYYATKSPLDSWSPSVRSASSVEEAVVDEKAEVKKIANHGWHNPVYIVQEEAGMLDDGSPESEL